LSESGRCTPSIGPILTLASQALGSDHQIKGSWINMTVLFVGFYPPGERPVAAMKEFR
jgi:hypothetical protein